MSHYPDDAVQSRALFERAKQSLPGGNTRTTVFMKPFPIYATHGLGFRVWDADGVARIDCINNFTAGIHGHAHPVLIAAAEKQLALGSAFGPTATRSISPNCSARGWRASSGCASVIQDLRP